MRITITSIDMKPSRCLVHTTEGKKYGVWADKVGKWGLEAGGTYDVEIETNEVNGRNLTNITSAKRVAGAPPAVASPASGNSSFYRPTAPIDAQRMFVTKLLGDAITSGAVKFDKRELWNATQLLCDLWEHSRLNPAHIPYSEAAE